MKRRCPLLRTVIAAASMFIPTIPAFGTWSMLIVDTRTGEIAVGSCTCLTNLDLQALTPVLVVGVGACTAQSAGDTSQLNRTFIRDRLLEGVAPSDILQGLSVFDQAHLSRQYGFVDAQGRTATFTGSGAGAWAGGQTGSFYYNYAGYTGHIAYAVQGNVLTGSPVVEAAVDAIRNTDGDVAARFMAGMEAARAMGGDGRCSCPGGVTTCGAPPTTFTKSAHIGYMLIARAGDRDGSSGVYLAGANPAEFAVADLTGDGRPELAATPTSSTNAFILTNVTPLGTSFARFLPATAVPVTSGTRIVELADFTGDGMLDLLALSGTTASVSPGLGNLAFGPRRDTALPGVPLVARVGNVNTHAAPDVVALTTTNSTLMTLLNDGTGTLAAPLTVAAGTSSTGVALADIDGNATTDALIVSRSSTPRMLVYKGNNNGTYTPAAPVVIPLNCVGLAAADFDHDGDVDAAVVSQATPRMLSIYNNSGTGAFTTGASFTLDLTPTGVVTGDFNGDGHADLAVLTSASQFIHYRGAGNGTFASMGTSGLGFASTRLVAADLTGDGRTDLIYNAPGSGVGITAARPDGTFPSMGGTAGGDYFLSLNVPNTTDADPDPVLTLQSQFNAWRVSLVGRVDAVQNVVEVPRLRPYLPGGSTGSMRVTLRDWRGEPVTASGITLGIIRMTGGGGAITAGVPQQIRPGVFEVLLTALGTSLQPDQFELTVQDGSRRVILMPRISVRQWQCPADFNGDGDMGTDADVEAMFGCIGGHCCALCLDSDINGDGDSGTDQDIEAFFIALGGGCG